MTENEMAPRDREAENQAHLNAVNVYGYKQELCDTDYVVIKIAEAQALGEDVSPLLDEYKETLNRRKELRRLINEKELKSLRQK